MIRYGRLIEGLVLCDNTPRNPRTRTEPKPYFKPMTFKGQVDRPQYTIHFDGDYILVIHMESDADKSFEATIGESY